MTGQC